jgi:hypothetical protein
MQFYSRWNISYLSFIDKGLSFTFFFRDILSRASLADPANSMPSMTTGDFGSGDTGAVDAGAETVEGACRKKRQILYS